MEAKSGVTLGMSMTEKQGGSDVRTNSTVAAPLDPSRREPGDLFALTGHKWFTSAPMSDGFFTLAYTDHGLACFLVPRWLDGKLRSATPIPLPPLPPPPPPPQSPLPLSIASCLAAHSYPTPSATLGERNAGLQFLRLKEKLGDKSNASSEVEYRAAKGWLVGEGKIGPRFATTTTSTTSTTTTISTTTTDNYDHHHHHHHLLIRRLHQHLS